MSQYWTVGDDSPMKSPLLEQLRIVQCDTVGDEKLTLRPCSANSNVQYWNDDGFGPLMTTHFQSAGAGVPAFDVKRTPSPRVPVAMSALPQAVPKM